MPLTPRVPDLTALDLLLSVVELGSLGRAAQAHGISQPSAGSRIRHLEKLVGVPVLERAALGSRPTPEGVLVAEWAAAVVEAARRLDAGIATLRGEQDARLHVAASRTVAEHLLPRRLVALRAASPDTAVTLEPGNSAEVARAVLGGPGRDRLPRRRPGRRHRAVPHRPGPAPGRRHPVTRAGRGRPRHPGGAVGLRPQQPGGLLPPPGTAPADERRPHLLPVPHRPLPTT
ncbi:LysR family transcriptional regulator [Streptomyces sp. WAC06614]|uniref:LysR family transcriptional regulator n=1 Tax=Streptomyces sp. WAC06614 TaxID=2487416 RepID=UPI0021B02C38|nr:LysR family transcriptional regulator [Streptomyces sp. WAC06614]